jgi:L-lactate dehydrogenase
MPNACSFQSSFQNAFKVSVVGCGNVGAAAAYAMLLDGSPSELALFDRDAKKVEGLLLDFEHSLSFFDTARIMGSSDIEVCRDSELVVITAGARQKEGESRLDLLNRNRAIFAELIPQLAHVAPKAIFLVVSNPVDILVKDALALSGFPRNRVFGTGTFLDTARFRFHLSEALCLSPKSVDAFILGEHGESSFPVLSSANIAGKALLSFEGMGEAEALAAYESTREAAAKIIQDMGYTCYSIGVIVKEVMQAIVQHSKQVLPLSTVLEGEYGLHDVALSVPCIVDSSGISGVLEVPLNEKEQKQLQNSADVLKRAAQ